MSRIPTREDVERFQGLATERFGLAFDASRQDQLARVLMDRAQDSGSPSVETYLNQLQAGPAQNEYRALAEILTVAETYFFRHPDQLRAFVDVALTARLRHRPQGLRILSAGCSSGEEPYTVAMLLLEQLGEEAAQRVEILGLNVNTTLLGKAREGRYSEWALRNTPEDLRQRYFRQEGREYLLDPVVREMVVFEERNLVAEDPAFWSPGAFDIIFCRNVLMYFTPEAMRQVVDRLAGALAPEGSLFLGPAETLRGLSQAFHLRQAQETFFYQLKAEDGTPTSPSPAPTPLRPAAPASALKADTSWLETIARASARIEILSQRTREAQAESREADAIAVAQLGLADVTDLLRQERFQEAMDALEALPASEADADAQLVLGVLLAQKGDYIEAEKACRRVLVLSDLNAGAHYLAALCREQTGDTTAAADHDRAAIYLDPSFAMPHLHLALMARKQGRPGAARRELDLALPLLMREDAARILLFGGGFSREALMNLCRVSS